MATVMSSPGKSTQIRLTRTSASYWRVTFDNPPLNLMGAAFVPQFREIVSLIEADEHVKVVLFDSPDAALDKFVDALATRIASFDKWAIANTKHLVNEASLPPDVEIAAGWQACLKSLARPAAQQKLKTLFEQGFHKPGDAENHLGAYVEKLGL